MSRRQLPPQHAGSGPDDQSDQLARWSRWFVIERWRAQTASPVDGRLMEYGYATRPEEHGDEHSAFMAACSALHQLAHDQSDSDILVHRVDYSRSSGGRVSPDHVEWLLRMDVTALDECESGWRSYGLMRLCEALEKSDRFRYDKVPVPHELTGERRERTLAFMRGLRADMRRLGERNQVVKKPVTQAEYDEAKAEGWDRFGDSKNPGPPMGDEEE